MDSFSFISRQLMTLLLWLVHLQGCTAEKSGYCSSVQSRSLDTQLCFFASWLQALFLERNFLLIPFLTSENLMCNLLYLGSLFRRIW